MPITSLRAFSVPAHQLSSARLDVHLIKAVVNARAFAPREVTDRATLPPQVRAYASHIDERAKRDGDSVTVSKFNAAGATYYLITREDEYLNAWSDITDSRGRKVAQFSRPDGVDENLWR